MPGILSRAVTLGIYLSDCQKIDGKEFRKYVEMVCNGKGEYRHNDEEIILYRSVRLPIAVIDKLSARAYEMDRTIVSYTAGVFHSLVNNQ